jgi:mycofactocin precursor
VGRFPHHYQEKIVYPINYRDRRNRMKEKETESNRPEEIKCESPDILEEIEIEDLTVDGICGVY